MNPQIPVTFGALFHPELSFKDEMSVLPLLLLSGHCLLSKKVSLESFLGASCGDDQVKRASFAALMEGGFSPSSALTLQALLSSDIL